MSKMSRYLLREATIPFLSLLLLGLALLVVNRMLKVLPWLFEFNVPLWDLLSVLLYLIPSFMIYALPIAVWVGWMVGYGRLGSDGELTAFASLTASPTRLLRPAVVSGLVMFVIALWVSEYAYGQGRLKFQYGLSALATKAAGQSLEPGSLVQLNDQLWLAVPEPSSDTESAAESSQVYIIREPDMVLAVQHAAPLTATPGFYLEGGTAFFRAASDPVFAAFAQGNAQIDALGSQEVYAGAREQSLTSLWMGRQRAHFAVEFHQRLALSFALLIAPLAAFAAAPRRSRSGRGRAGTAALIGFVVYYGLFTAGKQIALKGWLPIGLGMWLGNGFLLFVAVLLIYRKQTRPGLP